MICQQSSRQYVDRGVVIARRMVRTVMRINRSVVTGTSGTQARPRRSAAMVLRGVTNDGALYVATVGCVCIVAMVCLALLETVCRLHRSITLCRKNTAALTSRTILLVHAWTVTGLRQHVMIQSPTRGGSNLYGYSTGDRHLNFARTISNFEGGVFRPGV